MRVGRPPTLVSGVARRGLERRSVSLPLPTEAPRRPGPRGAQGPLVPGRVVPLVVGTTPPLTDHSDVRV